MGRRRRPLPAIGPKPGIFEPQEVTEARARVRAKREAEGAPAEAAMAPVDEGSRPLRPERDQATPRPVPRELPSAPEHEPKHWTSRQILGLIMLLGSAFLLLGVTAVGIPLDLIGGKAVLLVPLISILLLMRGAK